MHVNTYARVLTCAHTHTYTSLLVTDTQKGRRKYWNLRTAETTLTEVSKQAVWNYLDAG